MLKRLTIDNFALINHIDVAFDDGLSIITGETGAGKSIIIGALSLLLGSRADSKSVKDRNEKMVVEAVFDIGDYDLRALFESYGLDYFPEETIVRRELLPSGRSRAFINDMPVQLATVSACPFG
jgi:DNA repair protein RecN (Recombination protein N)